MYFFLIPLTPGNYRYKFNVDGEDRVEESSSFVEANGVKMNVVLVVNPFLNQVGANCPTKINLRNMFLYDDGAWAFSHYVQRNSHIISLDLSNNNISDDGMQAIGQACKNLLVLEVSC